MTSSEPDISEIVSKTIRYYSERGVTFRRYGPNGEFIRPMVHRFPASKLKGSVDYLTASIIRSNAILASWILPKK